MTAGTTQSNKIVSNKVEDNSVPLEPSYGKKNKRTFWPSQGIIEMYNALAKPLQSW